MNERPSMNRRRWTYLAFSVLTTAGIFGYLLTRVPLGEVLDLIRKADHRGIAMFVALSLTMSVFRTWRYAICLRLWGYRPGVCALYLVVLVRNFFSDLLPARLGSLVYVFLATTRLGVPLGAATSSFAFAFVFDLIALAPLIVLAAWFAGAGSRISSAALVAGAGVLGAVTVGALLVLPRVFTLGGRVVAGLRFLPVRWREGGRRVMDDAAADTQAVRDAGLYFRLLVTSVLVRVFKYACLYMFLYALLRPRGYGFGDLPPSRVFLGLCASEAAASTPVSGIAGFGAYEGAWAAVFQLLGFPGDIARLTSISHHLFTQVYGYSLGALALLVLLLPWFKTAEATPLAEYTPTRASVFYLRVLGALAAAAAVLWALCKVPRPAGWA